MGNTSLTLTDAYAAANNQAAMAFAEGPAFGVSALQYFSLSELTSLWGCAVLPAAGCFWFIGSSRWQSDFPGKHRLV